MMSWGALLLNAPYIGTVHAAWGGTTEIRYSPCSFSSSSFFLTTECEDEDDSEGSPSCIAGNVAQKFNWLPRFEC